MKRLRLDRTMIRLLYIIEAFILLCTMLGRESMSSVLFYATFILVFGLWYVVSIKAISRLDYLLFAAIGLALFSVCISALVTGVGLSFGYIKKVLIFSCSLMFFRAVTRIQLDKKTALLIHDLNTIVALLFIVMYIAQGTQRYLLYGRISSYLILGFTNPNLTAMFMLFVAMLELLSVVRRKSLGAKAFHFLLSVVLAYFVVETKSRNCILVYAAFVVLFALSSISQRKDAFLSKWMIVLLVLWPTIFVALYMVYVESSFIQQTFSFLVDEGKELSARVSIWRYALGALWEHPLFGAYSQISGGTGSAQMHNTHLDIAVSYGLLVYVLVAVFLYRLVADMIRRYPEKVRCQYFLAFLVALCAGMSEAGLFSGGLGIYLYAGVFLLLGGEGRGSYNQGDNL